MKPEITKKFGKKKKKQTHETKQHATKESMGQ